VKRSETHTLVWADAVARFDGYVFVSPEYNQSFPGKLKNALDRPGADQVGQRGVCRAGPPGHYVPMPPTEHLLAFLLASALIIGVPGPSVLFVITRSITLGRRAGVATVVGNAFGVYVQVILVAFGLGAIVQRSVAVFTVIKLVGALYLVYLGIQAFRHRGDLATSLNPPVSPKTVRHIAREGFFVGLANPKSIVAFVALLPQFVDPAAGGLPQQFLVLGAMWFALAIVLDGAWALLAGTARGWLTGSSRRLEVIGGASGVTMIGIGAQLALSGRKD